jgi:phosphatidylserine/phosphatidylglycerophosphate/cardiolipin synthase-like enzyme
MATWAPLLDSLSVERTAEVAVALADPAFAPPVDPPLTIRPDVARFAGRSLVVAQLALRAGVTSADLVCPMRSAVRKVALDTATPLPGITELLELSPLPFSTNGLDVTAAALRASAGGVPTFYVAPFDAVVAALPQDEPLDDSTLDAGVKIATITGSAHLFVGVLFQDSVAILPAAALRVLGDAFGATAAPASDVAAWRRQLDAWSALQLHVVRHDGRPIEPGATFDVELRRVADDATEAQGSVTLGNDADLEAALVAAPIGALASFFAPPAEHYVALRWRGDSPNALPVHALYATAMNSAPGEFLALPTDLASPATLQVLDLDRWYPPQADGLNVARFRTDSLVVPLVDGMAVYHALVTDLKAAVLSTPADRSRAHLAGWTFNRFQMDPSFLRSDIVEIAEDILARGGSVKILATRFFNPKNPTLDDARYLAALVLVLLTDATLLIEFLVAIAQSIFKFPSPDLETDDWVVVAWFTLPAAVGLLGTAMEIGPVRDFVIGKLEDLVESAKSTVDDLNDLASDPVAVFSSNPVTLDDNPLAPLYGADPFLGLEDDIDQFGVYHNKMQLVKRPPDARGDAFIGYLGGIDINRNRMDSPGHQVGGPYHDVHARIGGPVVVDAFASFYERWMRDTGVTRATLEAELPPPLPADMPHHDEKHIARIGRTYPRAANGLDFAPHGDRGTYDTLLAALAQARDYIYIEEQYFALDDGFTQALCDAGQPGRCKRLAIVMPAEGDQPFGDLRRRHVLDAIRDVWGDRMVVGFPQRRPLLPRTDRFASRGRTWLVNECSPADSELHLAVPARVIDPPFWLWIDGELMLARTVVKPVEEDGVKAARVTVERGAAGGSLRWGAHPRGHAKGAPVTFSQVKGIYVHAKCMMIDDVFVSIGSTNLNRRGFFHDGEINVFAIPQALRAAADNPARALRTALWAEHLGIAPQMSASLLRDPIAGFDLFLRPHLAGNRFTALSETDIRPFLGISDVQLWPLTVMGILSVAGGALESLPSIFYQRVWNLLSDPTTGLDPAPTETPV